MRETSLIILLTFCLSVSTQGQNQQDFIFHYLDTKDGLSHNFVTSIVADSLNNKWIGTENGITKTNGNDFDYIKPSLGYERLNNENIETLFTDKSNRIWIGTKSGGVSVFDPITNQIKNLNHLIDLKGEDDMRIEAIAQDAQGNIWIGTWEHGFFVVDPLGESLIFQKMLSAPIRSIKKGHQKDVWVSYPNRIERYDHNYELLFSRRTSNPISDFIFDTYRKKMWFIASRSNTYLYNYNYGSAGIDSINTGILPGYKATLGLDKNNRLWIGTWGKGLYRSDDDISQFEKIELYPKNSENTRKNYDNILALHTDHTGQLWVGTANAGVVKLIPGKGFRNLTDNAQDLSVFSGSMNITSIHKAKDVFLLGTLTNGLFTGSDLESLKPFPRIPKTQVKTIYRHRDKIFIGARTGFYVYEIDSKKIIFQNSSYRKITCFYVDRKDNLFIGTQQQGLAIVPLSDLESPDAYRTYQDRGPTRGGIQSNRITGIQGDNQGKVWISTYNGLHCYDDASGTVKGPDELMEYRLPSVITNTLYIQDENIWLGTPGGLFGFRHRPEEGKLIPVDRLTVDEGLKNDFIASLTSDDQGKLWFSTITNIVRYDPGTKKFMTYGSLSGIKTTAFNSRSSFNDSNQKLYFGGIDNITYFDPLRIDFYEEVPEVTLSSLRIDNESVRYDPENQFIDKSFGYADRLTLKPYNRFVSISFSANDFLSPENINYRYRLNNDKGWIELKDKNKISFAGLAPGDYTLGISATRNNQVWSESRSLQITVEESIWLSWWALLAYAIILVLSIFYFIRFKRYQQKLKTDLKIVKIEKEKEFALNETKINFFTNISHEFRTPLTLIIGPLKELIDSDTLGAAARKKLDLVERNAEKLLHLINQLLDFRKAENGLLKLNASEGNFVRFSNEVFLYFQELANEKEVSYKFKPKSDEIRFPFDRSKMEIVLCNLISNALKYTHAGNSVTIRVSEKDGKCIVEIKDTGIGMKAEDQDKIFDRFFQITSSNTTRIVGSGIGLAFSKKLVELHHGRITVKSKPGKGTEFRVEIAMDAELYKDNLDKGFINTDNIEAYNIIGEPRKQLNPGLKEKQMVLVIDDNSDILTYLFDILQDDYEVILADNGEKGYQLAAKEIPDLIVSDVMMPGKDGISLCKDLKSNIQTSHIPVILLTARTSTVYEIEGLKTGASDYISKPFNPAVIKARIAAIMESQVKTKEFLANKIRFEPTEDILATNENEDTARENAFLKEAMELVENNLQNPEFCIETMLEKLHMSQSTLYRKIKSLTGLSLTAFIRSIRIKHAAGLMLSTDRNLNEIAYDVGFNDYKYFRKNFKKQFKCLPSDYKDRIAQH